MRTGWAFVSVCFRVCPRGAGPRERNAPGLATRRGVTACTAPVLGTAGIQPPPATTQAAGVPAYDHVFVIVMENHSYGQIIGSSSAPYVNGLLSSGALATNYSAVSHPSLPNYLALTGGSTYGVTSDCTTCWVPASN